MDKLQVKLLQFFLIAAVLYLIYKHYRVETIEGFPSEYDLVNLNQIRSNSQYLDPQKVNDVYVEGTRPLSCWGGSYNYISCCYGTDDEKARCFPEGHNIYTEQACCSNSVTLENLMDIANDNRDDQDNGKVCLTDSQGDTLIPSMSSPDSEDNIIQRCSDLEDSSTMNKEFNDINEARMIFGLWPCVGGDKDVNISDYALHHIDCQNGEVESDDSCNNRDEVLRDSNYRSSGQECNISDNKAILDLSGHLQCTVFDGTTGDIKEIRTYYDCFKNHDITGGDVNMDTQCINNLESLIVGNDNFYCNIKHGEIETTTDADGNEYQILNEGFVEIQEDGSYTQQEINNEKNTLHRNSYYFIPNHQTIDILRDLFDINEKQYSEGRLPYEMDCDQDGNENTVDGVTIKRIGNCQKGPINTSLLSDNSSGDQHMCIYEEVEISPDNIIVKDENENIIVNYKSLSNPLNINESCGQIYDGLEPSCDTIIGESFSTPVLNEEFELYGNTKCQTNVPGLEFPIYKHRDHNIFLHYSTTSEKWIISQGADSLNETQIESIIDNFCVDSPASSTCTTDVLIEGTCSGLDECNYQDDNINFGNCFQRLTYTDNVHIDNLHENSLLTELSGGLHWRGEHGVTDGQDYWNQRLNRRFICETQNTSFYLDENCVQHPLNLLQQGPNDGRGFLCHCSRHNDGICVEDSLPLESQSR